MNHSQKRRRVRVRRRSRLGKRGFVLAALREFEGVGDIAWACAGVIDVAPVVVNELERQWATEKFLKGNLRDMVVEAEEIRDWIFDRLLPGGQVATA